MFRVFVVDDERIAQNNIIDALTNHTNWQVVSVFSSSVGLLNKAKELKPDVIFLDIKMPGETGLSIAKQLIALPQAPLIVFVTAFSEYALKAFELYAVDYLIKPFDDSRIAICIDKLETALNNTITPI